MATFRWKPVVAAFCLAATFIATLFVVYFLLGFVVGYWTPLDLSLPPLQPLPPL